jgi:16S rRNA (guanine527-N7)-methyltransferase
VFHVKHLEQLLEQEYSKLFTFLSRLFPGWIVGSAERLSEETVSRLIHYLEILDEWTTRVDLVSPAPLEILLHRHLLDSLAAGILMSGFADSRGYVDVGSGAGLPGIVLALFEPQRRLFLVEPRNKRCVFLSEVKRRLSLDNVEVLENRLDAVTPSSLAVAGTAVFRGLSPDKQLLTACRDLLPSPARVIHLAGPNVQPKKFGAEPWQRRDYSLGPDGDPRCLLFLELS